MNKLTAKDDLHANVSGDYQHLPLLQGEEDHLPTLAGSQKNQSSIIYELLDAHTRISGGPKTQGLQQTQSERGTAWWSCDTVSMWIQLLLKPPVLTFNK